MKGTLVEQARVLLDNNYCNVRKVIYIAVLVTIVNILISYSILT